jgi:hypothetical protein
MTDAKIERVARAICTAAGIDPDRKSHEPENDFVWQDFIKEAIAAIEAMPEPDQGSRVSQEPCRGG